MEKGKLLIFSAPSGSGKTTLLNHLLSEVPGIAFSVSATTRAPRGEEQNGVEYYFMSLEEFQQRVANDEFLEWEEVYPGRCYGTLKAVIEKMRNEGYHVAFDVDVVLRERLVNRGTDSMEEIEKRVSKAAWETEFAQGKFDTTIINDDLDTAKREIVEKVLNFFQEAPAETSGTEEKPLETEENPTV